MITTVDAHCSIMWGNATDFPISHKSAEFESLCLTIGHNLGLKQLIFPNQIHGVSGFFWDKEINATNPISLREYEGDFIITNKSGVGIGVLTADCLPIIFYFPHEKIIAAVHAGWRGNTSNIYKAMLDELQKHAIVNVSHARIFFGPAAKQCCYEVGNDFLEHIKHLSCKDSSIKRRDGKLFFDNTALAIEQLKAFGFDENNIDKSMHHCTICTPGFHSYRNTVDKEFYKTQGSIVWLNI